MAKKQKKTQLGYVLIRLPIELHKDFKLFAIEEGESMQQILLRFIANCAKR